MNRRAIKLPTKEAKKMAPHPGPLPKAEREKRTRAENYFLRGKGVHWSEFRFGDWPKEELNR